MNISSYLHDVAGRVFSIFWRGRRFALGLCLILRMSSASALEFYTVPSALLHQDGKDRCGIVTVHSLSTKADGKVFRQSGIGWVVIVESEVRLLTPFHVVVNADRVYAECKGEFFNVQMPSVDPEKDLAMFTMDSQSITTGKLMPLIFATHEREKAKMDKLFDQSDYKIAYANPNIPRATLKSMFEVLLAIDSFGIALPVAAKGDNNYIVSPSGSNLVQGFVESKQVGIKQLLRIENFGIRPGLSGAPLFGVPDTTGFRSFNENEGSLGYRVPIELLPKILLGMVTKTRMNGAETVAISLPDIYDFIESQAAKPFSRDYKKQLQVRYDVIDSANGEEQRLKSFLRLAGRDDTESRDLYEVCSDEYKISADLKVITNPQIFKKMEAAPKPKVSDDAATKYLLKDSGSSQKKFLNDKNIKRGGGEYGEGGDSFASGEESYLTSKFLVGRFANSDLKFRVKDESRSLGLYLKEGSCVRQGIWQGEQLINVIRVPGQAAIRFMNYEDVKSFFSQNGDRTYSLVEKYGAYEVAPVLQDLFKDGEVLEIPLTSVEHENSNSKSWSPGDRLYFKEKKLAFKSDANSILYMSKDRFLLNTPIKGMTTDGKSFGWIQLLYQDKAWHGKFALSGGCNLQLDPQKFTQVNPWLVEYRDGKTLLNIEIAHRDRLANVTFKKVACADFEKLALGEIEVYASQGRSPVIGTHRTALIPVPIDVQRLMQKFPVKASGGAQ